MDKHSRRTQGDTNVAQAARQSVIDLVLEQIQKGRWVPGDRLPTVTELGLQFSTSRSNVNQAMKRLEADGIIRRYRRRGTFVANLPEVVMSKAMDRHKPRTRVIHVIAPLVSSCGMHWDISALGQLEMQLNNAKLQMMHHVLTDLPEPAEFKALVDQILQTEPWGIVILVNLHDDVKMLSHGEELLPYVRSLVDFPGKTCLLNRSGAPLTCWPYDSVSLSPLDEGVAVGHYLIEQDAKHAVCVGLDWRLWSRHRVAGVKLVAQSAGVTLDVETLWLPEGSVELQNKWMMKLLSSVKNYSGRPTFIMPNDHYAARIIDVAKNKKLSCPEDFCVISFDNNTQYRQYNITSVAPPAARLGEVIGELMKDKVYRPAHAAINIQLKSVIVERLTFTVDESSQG